MYQEQEGQNSISKKEKLEELASEWGYRITFRHEVERHSDYVRLNWSDGTYSIISEEIQPYLKDENITLKRKMLLTDHRLI